MSKIFIQLFLLLSTLTCFSQDDIDYQSRRLTSALKKSGISGFSQLVEMGISQINSFEIKGKFYRVKDNSETSEVKYVFVGRVNSCRSGGCSTSERKPEIADSEYFDYLMFFDSSKKVILVDVFNYQATHGYEITAKGWLKQFIGFTGKDSLLVNKNIDGISGATISVYAITADIQEKTRLLRGAN